ncbi:hypothetical protein GE061_001380 [Apolygus lucorum]|uniref:Integrase catalytic domain-containing protein n=1 Tax=Apolygus lucorum TaxID=248454 RepID=A0A8S9Y6V6_APOLU|nr:hypothetical protein GE061_001380 [Apolygus lucorum]
MNELLGSSSVSSASTISLLEGIFSVHCYPAVLVSDNACIFCEEFQCFIKDRGIFQKFSAPNHPATNGLAERAIQTPKRRLKAATGDPTPLPTKLQSIWFRYRATPLASGQSPAELYLKRRIRTRLDALLPNSKARIPSSSGPLKVRSLQVGERVQARVHLGNCDVWRFGTLMRRLGRCHYMVELDSGRSLKRHINQLISVDWYRGSKWVLHLRRCCHSEVEFRFRMTLASLLLRLLRWLLMVQASKDLKSVMPANQQLRIYAHHPGSGRNLPI